MVLINADHILTSLEDDTSWFNSDDISETLDNIYERLYEEEGIGRIEFIEDRVSKFLN